MEGGGGTWREVEGHGGMWREVEERGGTWREMEGQGGTWRDRVRAAALVMEGGLPPGGEHTDDGVWN